MIRLASVLLPEPGWPTRMRRTTRPVGVEAPVASLPVASLLELALSCELELALEVAPELELGLEPDEPLITVPLLPVLSIRLRLDLFGSPRGVPQMAQARK